MLTGQGSSPLARGLHAPSSDAGAAWRIIPARAGFTSKGDQESSGRRDHPRSRGVYTPPRLETHMNTGSSPLARGLPREFGYIRRGGGIIPARAGFTSPLPSPWAPPWDHPRSRSSGSARSSRSGSSPLARGLLLIFLFVWLCLGIIPARAGFTCSRRWGRWSNRDHPRSRGVYSI